MRADVYEALADQARVHWWFQARERILLRFIEAHRTLVFGGLGAGRILDVGAGAGQLSAAMLRFGEVTALEGAPEALEVLGSLDGVEVVPGFLPNPGLPKSHFDLATAFDVMEHIEDDRAATREIFSVLRPGGFLLMTVPAHPYLWSDHDTIHHHFRRYRPAGASELLESAGFRVQFATPFQCYLFPLLFVERLTRRLLSRGGEGSARLGVPPGPINLLLKKVFSSEATRVSREKRFPVGSSQLVFAQKPTNDPTGN
jgi:SAM-dependent methyltransferase